MPRRAHHIQDASFLQVLQGALARGELAFPDACRAIRAREGLTQLDLARRARVALKVIKDLENGTGNPTLQSLSRIAAVAGLCVGLAAPASASVQFDGGQLMERQSRARRRRLKALKSGTTSLKKEHRRTALRGADFTIQLAKID